MVITMLQPNEVLELVRAGYSKDEIEALKVGDNEDDVEVETKAEDEKDNSNHDVQDTKDIDAIINEHVNHAFDKLNASVEAFNKKLESFNLMNAEMTSTMQQANQEKSIEDILLGSFGLSNDEKKGD